MAEVDVQRSPSSRSRTSSLGIKQFGFESKTLYDASEMLFTRRSDSYLYKKPVQEFDIWKKPPPDFRMQCYEPRPAKRNSRDAVKPWRYISNSDTRWEDYKTKKKEEVSLPRILQPKKERKDEIVTRFRIPDPFEARKESTRTGMNEPGPYSAPKPHDFRAYPPLRLLGLDEFETNHEKDPYNIHFKTNRLNIIHGLKTVPLRDLSGDRMAPPKKYGPKWEAALILPKNPYPNKAEETTRHRRLNRSVKSALYERIETRINENWAKEKMEQALRHQQEISKGNEVTEKQSKKTETVTFSETV